MNLKTTIPNTLLFTAFLLYSLNTFAKIKEVELIYKPETVLPGNNIGFTLKFTDHKNRVFYSTGSKAKYKLDNYRITSSIPEQKVLYGTDRFYLEIPKNNTIENITLTFTSIIRYDETHTFTVPVINYIKNAVNIDVLAPDAIKDQTIIPLTIYLRLLNGDHLPVSSNRGLPLNEVQVEVSKGGTYNAETGSIYVQSNHFCDNELQFSVTVKEAPHIKSIYTHKIERNHSIRLEFSGKQGNFTQNGTSGLSGSSGGMKVGEHGLNGGSGSDGRVGQNGSPASNLNIHLALKTLPCEKGPLVQVKIQNTDTNNEEVHYIVPDKGILNIRSIGGKGGNGGKGGKGGNGGDGRVYLFQGIREISDQGSGGRGGNGGRGGDGGTGGDGGNVIIYYSEDTAPYIDQLLVQSLGGPGGTGGVSGTPGRGGDVGNGLLNSGSPGGSGQVLMNGRNGMEGRQGVVRFVEVFD